MRVSPFDAPSPRGPAALAAQIFKDVVQGDGKAQRAAELLGQKGIQKILTSNKYGIGPNKVLGDLLKGDPFLRASPH